MKQNKLPKRKCKFSGCDVTFQKVRPLDMFCSPKCGIAHKNELADKKAESEDDESDKKYKNNFIAPVSKKLLGELAIYRPMRDGYLSRHDTCEVEDCGRMTTNLHHIKGREGYADDWARDEGVKLLWDVRFFMACCGTCHPTKIHENPEWARRHGYIQ